MDQIDVLKIRQLIRDEKYLIKSHARKRMAERGIRECEVLQVLLKGSIVEETLDAKPFPKCLLSISSGKTNLFTFLARQMERLCT